MLTFFRQTLLVITVVATVVTSTAAPTIPGLHNKHPLTELETGELLLDELRCTACHSRQGASLLPEKTAPDLSDIGSRVSPKFLQQYLASPSAVHAGTTMPDMLTTVPADKRDEVAQAITQFLIAQSPNQFQSDTKDSQPLDLDSGNNLFHTVGCVACHSPRGPDGTEETQDGVVGLGHTAAKYSRQSLKDFLFQPKRTRPSGRMPDMKLSHAEAQSLADYLFSSRSDGSDSPEPFSPQMNLVDDGKKYYQQLNCAACHLLKGMPAATKSIALSELDPSRGCLDPSNTQSPRYNLTDQQTDAIRVAVLNKQEAVTDQSLVAMTMTAFNCIACHLRDDYGGVTPERNLLFQTSEKSLGDDARIPPPLTLVGAKLQSNWMKKVLFDGEAVRPYMLTRMPQYGTANLAHLPDLFSRLDSIDLVDLPIPNPESNDEQVRAREKELRAAGRQMLGSQGLYCVACHNFNGKPSPNNKGMDLMTSFQRLKPSWFYHFMVDPAKYRPRIVMPASWPGGTAIMKTVLDGDTHSQINAIWYYLSLGTSAADPAGIQTVETKLAVSDTPRVYRGRSNVAGYRGIAVGFPCEIHYAFNAETGSVSALWRGEFIRVDRSGQGSGSFNPTSQPIALPQDVSFFAMKDENTPWPLRPVMTKESPVNPNPLYPKNVGYQFRGYYIAANSIPTFLYRSGDIEIEDSSTAVINDENEAFLNRELRFRSPQNQTLWFRALTGKIEAESDSCFTTADIRFCVPPTRTLLRPLLRPLLPPAANDETAQELLLHLEIPAGESKLNFTYELLH